MKFNQRVEVEINNRPFLVKNATPGLSKKLEDADSVRSSWQQENPKKDYRQDEDLRSKYWKQVAEACLDPISGDMPDIAFYKSDEFEYSTLMNVADFLSGGGRTMFLQLSQLGTDS